MIQGRLNDRQQTTVEQIQPQGTLGQGVKSRVQSSFETAKLGTHTNLNMLPAVFGASGDVRYYRVGLGPWSTDDTADTADERLPPVHRGRQ